MVSSSGFVSTEILTILHLKKEREASVLSGSGAIQPSRAVLVPVVSLSPNVKAIEEPLVVLLHGRSAMSGQSDDGCIPLSAASEIAYAGRLYSDDPAARRTISSDTGIYFLPARWAKV
jgi:hypothetical protein